MRNLTVDVFLHLDITSFMEVKKRVAYMHCILRGAALKKYQEVLVAWSQSTRELTGDKSNLGKLEGLSAEAL